MPINTSAECFTFVNESKKSLTSRYVPVAFFGGYFTVKLRIMMMILSRKQDKLYKSVRVQELNTQVCVYYINVVISD